MTVPGGSVRSGAFVSLPEALGIGKIVEIKPPHATVRLFHSLAEHEDRVFPIEELRRAHLSPGTRVYVHGDTARPRIGRVVNFERREDSGVSYEVRFPNLDVAEYSEFDLSVRCWRPRGDPAEILAARIGETQWLHDRRLSATQAIVASQAGAKGMTALLASGIEFVPHQIAAVRRILCDPQQRYLLADEVGLGKTIEACVVIRQCLMDDPGRYVVVLAPPSLVSQWAAELAARFNLKERRGTLEILAHGDSSAVERTPDLLVIDEAHHLDDGSTEDAAAVAAVAFATPRLLLLSATPALADARRFLFLLTLLDREAYEEMGLEEFERLLASRRDVGRLLLGLNSDGSAVVLRRRAKQAAEMFPRDSTVARLSARLQEATKPQEGEVAELALALRTHIAETYRLNQRIVRARRSETAGWEFQPRGTLGPDGAPGLAHLRVEVDEDRRMMDLAGCLEDWRTEALGSLTDDADLERRRSLAQRFRRLVESLGIGVDEFAHELRQSGGASFAAEAEIRRTMEEILCAAPGPRTKVDVVADCLHRLHKNVLQAGPRCKILAFCTSTRVAREVHQRMTYGVVGEVCLLTVDDTPEEVSRTLRSFERSDSAWLLIADRAGEEGLNLSFADGMLHIDLPFAPARIEQRIGRIDRFGRTKAAIRQRVLLPFDDEGSVWSSWQSLLADVLRVYNEPISDLQFLLEGIELDLTEAMFERGSRGVESLGEPLRARLLGERQAQDEQHALDRFAVADDLADGIASSIEDAEANEEQYRSSIEPWLVDALQLAQGFSPPASRDVFSLKFDRATLVPQIPWQREFGLDDSTLFAWKRRFALERPGLQLIRPGSTMLDACERFMLWDDRGTTFLTWRVDPKGPAGDEPWIAFRVCVAIEPKMPQRKEIFARADTWGAWRRAQQFLAKSYHVLHVDSNGALIEDAARLEILERRYEQNASEGRRDINLGSRPQLLLRVMDPAELAEMCGRVASSAIQRLVASPAIQEAIATATRHARRDASKRGLRLDARAGWATDGLSAEQEALINDEIVAAIEAPSIRLDSIGLFVVSQVSPATADGTL